jgi:hypothetical protein
MLIRFADNFISFTGGYKRNMIEKPISNEVIFIISTGAQRQAFKNDITAILEPFLRQSGNGSADS